jgi:hypothetical protein
VIGLEINKPVHWYSLIEETDGDLDTLLSFCEELVGVVGEPSLLAAAIFVGCQISIILLSRVTSHVKSS